MKGPQASWHHHTPAPSFCRVEQKEDPVDEGREKERVHDKIPSRGPSLYPTGHPAFPLQVLPTDLAILFLGKLTWENENQGKSQEASDMPKATQGRRDSDYSHSCSF